MGRIGGTMGMSVTGCAGLRESVEVGGWPLTEEGVSVGGKFSSDWKLFFQSLENSGKIFSIIGKTGRIFPTIGNFFSNHWKNFARAKKGPDIESGKWLPDQDLNLNKQIQSLLCYRYTIGQVTRITLLPCGALSTGFWVSRMENWVR